MPTRRKSADQLRLEGGWRADRHADRDRAPAGVGKLGAPPKHLSPDAKRAWREIAKAAPWCTGSDGPLVEVTARLLAELRGPEPMVTSRIGALISALSRLGLSPADRSRITEEPKVEERELRPDELFFARHLKLVP
jgi:phage terminase small subunit